MVQKYSDLPYLIDRIKSMHSRDISRASKHFHCQHSHHFPLATCFVYIIYNIIYFSTYYISLADIVFSTAHKSKGLEFDTVQLTDDYSVYEEEDPRCMCLSTSTLPLNLFQSRTLCIYRSSNMCSFSVMSVFT